MRRKIFLENGWRFHLGAQNGADYAGFDDSTWREVSVPHDWAVEGDFSTDNSSGTGYLPAGEGWYRIRADVDFEAGERVYVTFEGVYNNSQVWCNSNYLGKRPYGYSTFTYEITDFVDFERPITLAVRVNHAHSADSRWYTGSGITRRVYITVTAADALLPGGVFVTTDCDGQTARVYVEAKTGGAAAANVICDASGNEIARGGSVLEVSNPNLWSPEQPYLYTLKTSVGDDCEETVFGIRSFEFDADKGFFLNGKPMKIKGVCLHHDAGCLGAAVPKEVWRRRLCKLRAAGCNAIRTSHNPPDVTLLELCDEMGFLVMDEAFDEWEGPKNKWWQGHNVYPPKKNGYFEDFHDWGERDIKAMVERDRNHPSVIIWSIGNEVDYPNDPYCHPAFTSMTGNNDANKPAAEREYDYNKPNAQRLRTIAQRLCSYVRECDRTRPVTAALAFPELSNITGYSDVPDIAGYNYKEHLYAKDHEKYPKRVIYGSENSHSPEAWYAVRDNDYICGQFLWTGVDYLGEAHGWPIRISGAGLLNTAGFEKPRYYMRRAMWCDEPCAYITTFKAGAEERRDRRRFGNDAPTWNYENTDTVHVMCFTNQSEAELFLNGKSMGKCAVENYAAHWEIPFESGKIECIAGSASCAIETSGAAAYIEAVCEDGVNVEIFVKDSEGRLVTNSEIVITVSVEGGKLLGLENGKIDDLRPYRENCRAANGGKLAAYIKIEKNSANILAEAQNIVPAKISATKI
ncbi:MAG: glycoside hydrolase family 2 TIM barrel-domain containing protein [Clostridia bacterium]|nr:glycoside hydrolase family 2 TIM barrel-domain containing protein [Clostridia bacterium]